MVHCVKFWTDFKFHWYAALSLKSGLQQCFPLSASGYILYIWDKEPQRLYQDSLQTAPETSFQILWRLSAGEIPFLTSAFFGPANSHNRIYSTRSQFSHLCMMAYSSSFHSVRPGHGNERKSYGWKISVLQILNLKI